jgi:precorrin-6B C5,15-methyltransferase / cobalt-precorrin-6B C5,C15-methyltransferase
MSAWLAIIGIGEDGLDGLGGAARALIESAELLVGGERHLALVPAGAASRLVWAQPLEASMAPIAAEHGRRVVVLASGDPLCYGVGAMLARHFPADACRISAPSVSPPRASSGRWRIAWRSVSTAGRSRRCAFILRPARGSWR